MTRIFGGKLSNFVCFFSGAFSSVFEFCQNLFSFFEKFTEVSKSFFSLLLSLSHFGVKLGIDFFRIVNWCKKVVLLKMWKRFLLWIRRGKGCKRCCMKCPWFEVCHTDFVR